MGQGLIAGCSSAGLRDLADTLSIRATPVIDATGLDGSWHFIIRSQWSHRKAVFGAMLGPRIADPDPNLPELSTALEEQLGLRLESRRGPIDVMVIDSVQQPTEN